MTPPVPLRKLLRVWSAAACTHQSFWAKVQPIHSARPLFSGGLSQPGTPVSSLTHPAGGTLVQTSSPGVGSSTLGP